MSWSGDSAAFNITSDHYMAQIDGRVSTGGLIYFTPRFDSTLSLSAYYYYDWPASVFGQAGLAILIYDFATEERIYDQGVQGDNIGFDPPHGTLILPAATVALIAGHDYIVNIEALTDQFNAGPPATSGQSSGEIHISITPCAEPAPPTSPTATPDRICVGQTSTLTASVGPGQTVDWYTGSCGDSLVPCGASPVVSPAATQTYYARARVISSGCVAATCSTATVTIANGTGDFDGGGVQDSDLPTFVDILLSPGTPQDCIADMNGDGAPDGRDVQMWTDAHLTP
ncbi:MAG TPA: hypothetical protein VJZ71_21585 [Phycisphaerae bacterium]|nr:hypothetical protein [Phycisphaerae bacterium]